MIDETIQQIEALIQQADALPSRRRAELLALLGKLKTEANDLAQTHQTQAQDIVSFAQTSAYAATQEGLDPERLKTSTDRLRRSVAVFEKSHPQLAQVVNTISTVLSNSGI
ncbi:MAG TPA: DUF4404 family protein [Verrucomicrobiota bacterium]|nr:DUF4404 family protein [Verrucomicrobiota bacterium]HNT15639.1 DUF4404 family protein [Verrucomicrobiota bacterium]